MKCKNCNSSDVQFWKFNLYGTRGYKVHCGHEYFRSVKDTSEDLGKED